MLGLWLQKLALRIIETQKPNLLIGPQEDPYMSRWYVLPRNHFFNMYIHEILHDDDHRALHDHPWISLSYMVQGGVFEITENDKRRYIGPGRWIYRSAKFAHRLALPSYPKCDHETVPAITVFFTGPKIRTWGFHCPKGWRRWQDYVDMNNRGQQGPGCD